MCASELASNLCLSPNHLNENIHQPWALVQVDLANYGDYGGVRPTASEAFDTSIQ